MLFEEHERPRRAPERQELPVEHAGLARVLVPHQIQPESSDEEDDGSNESEESEESAVYESSELDWVGNPGTR